MSDAKPKDIASSERTPDGWRYPVSQTNAPDFLTEELYEIKAALSPEKRGDPESMFEALGARLVARKDRVKKILRDVGCSGNLDIEYRFRQSLESVMLVLGCQPENFLKLTEDQICTKIEFAYKQGRLKTVKSQTEGSNPRSTQGVFDPQLRARVKAIRAEKNWTRADMSVKILSPNRISAKTIERWETTGKFHVSLIDAVRASIDQLERSKVPSKSSNSKLS